MRIMPIRVVDISQIGSNNNFALHNLFHTFLMLPGSVITGYHYLIDGYAGLLLGWGLYRLSALWIKREGILPVELA